MWNGNHFRGCGLGDNMRLFWLFLASPWALISASDFGGDFSANGLSGASAPGATAGTMGNKAASAMAIGTGSSGAGDYASSFKTPNYTQYTQQDFKGKFLLCFHI